MKVDLKITGGTIIDPERHIKAPGEVLIHGNRIVGGKPGEKIEAETIVHANDCLVLPGLIDFHAHLYGGGTESGVRADTALIPMGVTTGVDAGSCGSANYENFLRTVVATSEVRIFSFLNIAPAGLIVTRFAEELDPQYYDEPRIEELYARHRGQCLGLKIRLSKDIVGDLGSKPLEHTIRIAERLGCAVVVHTTDPPIAPEEIAAMLRPGDVYCHVYQGRGETILDSRGKVRTPLFEARRRGILFDTANGRKNFSFKVAKAALADGFPPDIISSDVTRKTLYSDFVFSLPFIMTKFLNMGMPLESVIAACTSLPSKQIGMQGKLGTLAPGALADVAIFRHTKGRAIETKDDLGDSLVMDQRLLPQMTIVDGRIVYRQIDFQ